MAHCSVDSNQHHGRFRFWILYVLFLGGIGWSSSTVAEPFIEKLTDFPEAEEEASKTQTHPELRIPLGMLKPDVRQFKFEKDIRIKGTMYSRTMRVPEHYDVDEIFNHFRMQLNARDAEALYQCESRACGSSNEWANQYFKQNVLFGPDRYQRLVVAKVKAEPISHYVLVYVIRRGNQRLYYHVASVQPEQMLSGALQVDSAVLVMQLEKSGFIRLPGIKFDDNGSISTVDDSAYETLKTLFDQVETVKLFLVGHAERGSLPASKAQSTVNAKDIAHEFRRRYPDLKNRIDFEGIGYLAPRPNQPANRIEVVKAQ